jgi:molybdopterin/thiamine biosynthesis adenylyltransferase
MLSQVLSELEIRRYSQNIGLQSVGLAGQEKIKQSKILVVGAGGKGTTVLQHLVTSGIGRVGICDNDLVKETALPNQTLFGNNDLGKHKAIISKQKLTEINHLASIELHNVYLSETNIVSLFKEYDIIVDATDNHPVHCLIDDNAARLKKPVVYGCVDISLVCVTVFNYNNGPSFRCMESQIPNINEKPFPDDRVNKGIISSITGTIMANEVLKIILGLQGVLSGELLTFDTSKYVLKKYKIKKTPGSLKSENESC